MEIIKNNNENVQKDPPKQILITFRSDGGVEIQANAGMMEFWGAAKLLEHKGDELYIMGMQQSQAMQPGLIVARGMKDARRS